LQIIIELIRTLLVDELSRRILVAGRSLSSIRRTIVTVHRRNRKRLINRLLTDLESELQFSTTFPPLRFPPNCYSALSKDDMQSTKQKPIA
jgi:hypothetical protein